MKLSTRSRYGVRALMEMAAQYGKGPISMNEISKRQNISRSYLHNILSLLKASGIIEAIKGKNGGFVLASAPADIRLDKVLAVLEGSISPTKCVHSPMDCNRSGDCSVRKLWTNVESRISATLAEFSLEDLLYK